MKRGMNYPKVLELRISNKLNLELERVASEAGVKKQDFIRKLLYRAVNLEEEILYRDPIGTTSMTIMTVSGRKIIDYLNANGDNFSTYKIADETGCTPVTVKKWIAYWRETK